MPSIFSIIMAMSKDGVIGNNNQLPWHLPADLIRFRELTIGHTVIMGRKTFESIYQKLGTPLPKRRSIVITKNKDFNKGNLFHDVVVANSFEEIIKICTERNEEYFIIGGAEIYKLSFAYATRAYITIIDSEFDGDTVFYEKFEDSEWSIVKTEKFKADQKNPHDYTFFVFERKDKKGGQI